MRQMPGLAMALNGANGNQGLGATCPTFPCSVYLAPYPYTRSQTSMESAPLL